MSDQAPQNTQGDELDAIVDFLCGKSALDGMWFGEKLANRPAFWWRERLRKAVSKQRNTPTKGQLELVAKLANAEQKIVALEVEREQAQQELLDELEPMTHNGRGTILWEMDAIADWINSKRTKKGKEE